MPTPTKPVPWPDVSDLMGDLFEFLAAHEGLSKAEAAATKPLALAARVLLRETGRSKARVVARSLYRLEKYWIAGHRAESGAADLSASERNLQFNDEPEREAEEVLRNFVDRFDHFRRLLGGVMERNVKRAAAKGKADEVEQAHALVLESLDRLYEEHRQLTNRYAGINAARTEFPLTLSGWWAFGAQLAAELTSAGVPTPPPERKRKASRRRAQRQRRAT
jgi:hypothetical protein